MAFNGNIARFFGLLLLASFAAHSGAALGQGGFYGGYGYGGFRGYHSSTAYESYQRGYADVVRAAGEYNLNTAHAASITEDAISKRLDNRLKATHTYFQMREANRQYRREQETPALSSEQLYRIAAEQAPETLAASDLDPLTGAIAWPPILQRDEFADARTTLNGLFQLRANEGNASSYVIEIQQVAQQALAQLKANIRSYPAPEYLAGKRFLESLAYSARAPNL